MKSLMSWVKQARLLVAVSLPECQFCLKKAAPSPELPGVCRSCYQSIPWIRTPRCQTCGRPVGCPDCSRSHSPVPIRCNRSAVSYTSTMREILGQYKYRGNERLTPILGLMLDRAYAMLQQEQRERHRSLTRSHQGRSTPFSLFKRKQRLSAQWQADLLVPVPVSAARLAERGFNQAEQLAGALTRRRGVPQLPLLVRTHHTAKQSFKSRSERLADMKHAFTGNTDSAVLQTLRSHVDASSLQPGQRPLQIVLIDDIYTTGSTIRACAEALQQLCGSQGYTAEIYALTWARS
ncbi:ComF family protein [Paenibacillus piscarius]|uniref:ComF family protein n=1 Tax=Paenibacillus piscarius TaxID=1089681 RepID=UPI001EE958FA|nr:ComF family protein [Paenibacillus piscarius]